MRNDPDDTPSNPTGTTAMQEVVTARLGRRSVLTGGLATAAATISARRLPATAETGPAMERSGGAGVATTAPRGDLLGFDPIGPSTEDEVRVPRGYEQPVLVPWGDPVVPSGPAFREDAGNTADEQAEQLGMGHDGMWFFPLEGSSSHGLLVINHEFTTDNLLFPDGEAAWDAAKTRKSVNAHGVAVVEIRLTRGGRRWEVVESPRVRRITGFSPMRFSGPAAGDARLTRAVAPYTQYDDYDPEAATLGTLNNCSMGHSPCGTYLTCEENFNGYFWLGADGSLTPDELGMSDETEALLARYGVSGDGFGYLWATTHDRFRADLYPNEPNRFGWVVEIDPYDREVGARQADGAGALQARLGHGARRGQRARRGLQR